MNNINNWKYIPALDGLRFLAFLWVLIGHLPRPNSHILLFQRTNWMGVDLFFVLSSFLITILLVAEFKKKGHISMLSFFIRRFLRIYPLYILLLLFGFFVFPLLSYDVGPIEGTIEYESLKPFFMHYIFLISNITLPLSYQYSPGNVLAPMWSIMVEFQFYFLICPLLIFIIKKNISYIKYFAVFLVVIALFYRVIVEDPKYIYTFLLGRLDSFGFGMLLAVIHMEGYINKNKNIFSCLFLFSSFFFFRLTTEMAHPNSINTSIFIYTTSGLFALSLMLLILNNAILAKILSFKVLVYLGKISLGLYLFHTIGIHIAANYKLPFIKEPYSIAIIALSIACFISIISYHFFEVYFIKLKNKFTIVKYIKDNKKEL